MLTALSGLTSLVLFFTNIKIGSITFAQHTLIVTCALTVIGIQSVFFWTFAKSVAIQKQLLFSDPIFRTVRRFFDLEKCLVAGGLLVMIGLAIACYGLFYWYSLSFGPVEGDTLIRTVCAASVLISIGFQLIFAAFFMVLIDQQPGHEASSLGRVRQKIQSAAVMSLTAHNSETLPVRPINKILLGHPNNDTDDTLNTNPLTWAQMARTSFTDSKLRLLSSAKKL